MEQQPAPIRHRKRRQPRTDYTTPIVIACVGLGLIVGGMYVFYFYGGDIAGEFRTVSKPSYEDYTRIENGMTFEQVRDILGPNYEETSRAKVLNSEGIVYTWRQQFGDGKCVITFSNNRVFLRAQEGLR